MSQENESNNEGEHGADYFGEEYVLDLRKPIMVGDTPYAAITLRIPTAAEYSLARRAQLNGCESDFIVSLVHQTGKVPLRVASQILMPDLAKATDFFGFWLHGQKT